MWRASILTLFPDMFPGPLGLSLAGDALRRGIWGCEAVDIRVHGLGRHRTVDDRPAGGGPGMVMRADVVAAAIDAQSVQGDDRPRLVMSPRGRRLDQKQVRAWAGGPGVLILCGRFEGIDERVIAARRLIEVSVGDYILSGGELAALAILDSCVRLLPGVMGADASGEEESFENGLLEYPHYTRPRFFEDQPIPEVLLGGDHGKIAAWRRSEAVRLTAARRPDLLAGRAAAGSLATMNDTPPFARDFLVEIAEPAAVVVRHGAAGHWWRFEVADKNGRLQLVHAAHGAGPDGPASEAMGVDAYDAATREARQRGMVD